MKSNCLKVGLLAVLGLASTVPTMSAAIIGLGDIAAPDIFGNASSYTLLASTGVVNVNLSPGSSFNAFYTEYVVKDSNNNNLCGTAGQCLSSLMDINSAGPGVVERIYSRGF